MNRWALLSTLCTLVQVISASHGPYPQNHRAIRTIYQFPNETWIENIAVRYNDNILVTLIFEPEVWQIDPTSGSAHIVHRFTDVTSVFGIAEVEHDVFAVAVGNWSYTDQLQPGTWSIWTIDLNPWASSQVRKVTDIPKAQYLEGMTVLPTAPGTILVADSAAGTIYAVNVRTGKYKATITNPYLLPNRTAVVPLGVNGIHTFEEAHGKSWLYFTNTFAQPFLGRIPLTPSGSAAGAVEEIVAYAPNNVEADDFALDREGNAYVCTNSANSVVKVGRDGTVTLVAGGQKKAVVAGADSAHFSRARGRENVLYVTTTGGIVEPPPSGIVGAKVVALDLSLL